MRTRGVAHILADNKPDRLLNRNFVLLWQGQLVSHVGSQAFVIALLYWTMEVTGSAKVMAMLVIGSTLPAIILGPFAGGGIITDVSGIGVPAVLTGFGVAGLAAVITALRSRPLRVMLAGGNSAQ